MPNWAEPDRPWPPTTPAPRLAHTGRFSLGQNRRPRLALDEEPKQPPSPGQANTRRQNPGAHSSGPAGSDWPKAGGKGKRICRSVATGGAGDGFLGFVCTVYAQTGRRPGEPWPALVLQNLGHIETGRDNHTSQATEQFGPVRTTTS